MLRESASVDLHSLQLDLDFNARGQIQLGQSVYRLGSGPQDVDEALVGPHLKLLAGILVLVGGAQDGHDLLLRGERDRAGHAGTGALGRLDDARCALVDDGMLIGLELDADLLVCHVLSSC